MSHPYLKHLDWLIDDRSGVRHLAIWRSDNRPIRCGWDTLQAVVHELLEPDETAVEFFPATDLVVNEVNRRHFWVYPSLRVPLRPA